MNLPRWLRWRSEQELEEELQAHLDAEIQTNLDRGLAPQQARTAALRTLGNRTRIKEDAREADPLTRLESVVKDLRYALRNLARNPGFTLAAVCSLALGIGANSAIFSFLDAALLRPMSVRRPGELVRIYANTPQYRFGRLSYRDFLTYRDGNRALTGMAAQTEAPLAVKVSDQELPWMSYGQMVNGGFFETLEVPAALGRTLTEADDQPGAGPVAAVLSHGAWVARFQEDPRIVGASLTLNGQQAVIVGVLPDTFPGTDLYERPEIFVPLAAAERLFPFDPPFTDPARRPSLIVLGRLRPGVRLESAQADLAPLAAALTAEYPETNRDRSALVLNEVASRFERAPRNAAMLTLLAGLVAMVLLIACTNVANLLLGRAGARVREMTIRASLGATRRRLMAQLLTESVLLAGLGAAAGLVLAAGAVRFFASLRIPSDVPIQLDARLDGRVLLYTLAAMAVSVLLFGLWPAARTTRTPLAPPGKGALAPRSRYWGRHTLVAVQTAMAALLLVIAGLFLQSFAFLSSASPGFRVENVLLAAFDPSSVGYSQARIRDVYQEIEERARALPGVRSAALASYVALDVSEGYAPVARAQDDPADTHSYTSTLYNVVTPGFFTTLDTPVLRGRGLDARDTETSPPVAVISEAMAGAFWKGGDAIGQRFRFGEQGPLIEVVGIARDAKYEQLQETPRPYIYLPYTQQFTPRMTLMLQTAGDPVAVVPSLRAEVKAVNPDLPVEIRTMRDLVNGYALMPARLVTRMVGVMGLTGLSLGVVGLYAVVAFLVSRRTREIGIRMALGASPASVLRGVLASGLTMSVAGVLVGLAGAWTIGPGFGSNLAGIDGRDPVTFAGVALLVVGVALAASWVPARRAARVDPAITLREE